MCYKSILRAVESVSVKSRVNRCLNQYQQCVSVKKFYFRLMNFQIKSLTESTVWLTGSNGFIGTNLKKQFITERINRLVLLSHRKIAKPKEIQIDHSIYSIEMNFGDSNHFDLLSGNLLQPHYLIMNGWAEVANPESKIHQGANVFQTEALFNTISKENLVKVVFLGSIDEYGNQFGLIDEEDTPVHPLSSYAIGKIAASHRLEQLAAQSKTCLLHLLVSNVYGPNQREETLLPQMKKCVQFAFSGKSYYRDYIFVEDLTKIVTQLLTIDFCGRLNVGSGEATHSFDFARKAWALMGKSLDKLSFDYPEVRDTSMIQCLNISKLKGLLGKNLKINGIESGLTKTFLTR